VVRVIDIGNYYCDRQSAFIGTKLCFCPFLLTWF